MRTKKFVDYHNGFRSLLCGPEILTMLKTLTGKVSLGETKTKKDGEKADGVNTT